MSRVVCKYEYSNEAMGCYQHTWSVRTAKVGLHFWVRDRRKQVDGMEVYGGLEIHYSEPPDYMREDAASHTKCWLLGCPCWHDGSSLQAEEFWIPLWKESPHDHEGIFAALINNLIERGHLTRQGEE